MVPIISNEFEARKTLCLLIFLITIGVAGFSTSSEAGHDEPRLIIIGNSLSTTHESWPNYLRGLAPRWNIHVYAQNGRSIRDYDPPRDLWTSGSLPETVIYFLGTNDVLQNTDIISATYRLRNHLSFLLDRNFKVLLLNIPYLTIGNGRYTESLEQHRALIDSFRGSHPNLWVYDVNNIWSVESCPDGIHPDADLSYKIAEAINWVLALNIY